MTKTTELLGSKNCVYTQEMREWLEWTGREFVECDVDQDESALLRLRALTGGQTAIPVLVEDGTVVQVGWQGRTCVVGNR
jgi:glutaredoxin 3